MKASPLFSVARSRAGRRLVSARLAPFLFALLIGSPLALAETFTPLRPLPAPRIATHAGDFPGDQYRVANLLDGKAATEYSSDGKGTNTFVEFDFGSTVRIGAFRHLDRDDPATVAASRLLFLDRAGREISTVTIRHSGQRGGETFFVLAEPVGCQRVRWQVTALGPEGYGTVGGAEIAFLAAGEAESTLTGDSLAMTAFPLLRQRGGELFQPLRVTVHHAYAERLAAVLRVAGLAPQPLTLAPGAQTVDLELPAGERECRIAATLEVGGNVIARGDVRIEPVRKLTVYVLPHSHTDIGYTEIQTDIEKKQVNNLVQGLEYARKTAAYPPGAQFKWNVEVGWAADLYCQRLPEAQRQELLAAVRAGRVGLDGMYLNELTGLCRPEELLQLFRYATRFSELSGVKVETAMISDVPGYTWGTVTAMAQAGIRYFSTAPNYFDRIGTILREWENKPFWWIGPSGKERVLVWIPFWGYAMSHRYGKLSLQLVNDFCDGLAKRAYPYDIAYVRWSGHGDNAVPDPAICDFIRDWNAEYAWPRFVISTTAEAFRAFEARYGKQLPEVRGDWTPYWEDGAGSSAFETSQNRWSSDRLSQAGALWAMRDPRSFPAADFERAWNRVLLYSEHTWGADVSVSDPESQKTREQWEIKRGYAEQAERQSRQLLQQALALADQPAVPAAGIDVINTTSWPRSEVVLLPQSLSGAGDRVLDESGKPLPSQRLTRGELAFVAPPVPPFGARRFTVVAGEAFAPDKGKAVARGNLLDNGLVTVRIDERTGAIVEFRARGISENLADTTSGEALNDYRFLPGDQLADLQRNGPVTITVKEPGPLVASLLVESAAPGCRMLSREAFVIAGFDHVELYNLVVKERAAVSAKRGDWQFAQKGGKESVNFAFPFHVPGGEIKLDLPLGLMRPEIDQIPSACKNWFTVGRWADVANRDYGVTWVTLDAPLIEVGEISANLVGSQTDPAVWRQHVGPTQRFYSWAMNNHWGTNYRAYQEGPVLFRYVLRPHRRPSPGEATRFATAYSQPLLVVPAQGAAPAGSRLAIASPGVVVMAMKPTDDARGVLLRLFGASGRTESTTIKWAPPAPKAVYLSDTSERRGARIPGRVRVPALGVVTLRADFD